MRHRAFAHALFDTKKKERSNQICLHLKINFYLKCVTGVQLLNELSKARESLPRCHLSYITKKDCSVSNAHRTRLK